MFGFFFFKNFNGEKEAKRNRSLKYPLDIPVRSETHRISGDFFSLELTGKEKKQKKPDQISCGY